MSSRKQSKSDDVTLEGMKASDCLFEVETVLPAQHTSVSAIRQGLDH